MPDTPHTVFVSHAHADNALCDRYVQALRSRGLDVWYDRTNMQDGHFLSQEIEAQLRRRTAFVLLVTPASLASYWVRLEVGAFQNLAAQDPARLMLPVRIAECEMPLLMMGIKWIDGVSLGFDAGIDALAKALCAPGTPPLVPSPAPSESVGDLFMRGATLYSAGKHAEALAIYERALTLDPNNADAWAGKGFALTMLGRYNEALGAFERALAILERTLALSPNDPNIWASKSAVLRGLGRDAEADAALRRASELWRKN